MAERYESLDADAFVRGFAPRLDRWARAHLTGDAAHTGLEVDDVVQEVAARAWKRWGDFAGVDDALAWAAVTARHLVCDEARSAWARRSWWTLRDRIDECLAGTTPDVADLALRNADSRTMLRALALLSAADQQLLLDRYVDDATIAELARRHGVSEPALKKRLVRARRRLHAELARTSTAESTTA